MKFDGIMGFGKLVGVSVAVTLICDLISTGVECTAEAISTKVKEKKAKKEDNFEEPVEKAKITEIITD